MPVVLVTATLSTAASAPVAGTPPRPGDLQLEAAARAEAHAPAGAVAGVEDAGRYQGAVAAGVAGGRVSEYQPATSKMTWVVPDELNRCRPFRRPPASTTTRLGTVWSGVKLRLAASGRVLPAGATVR